MKEHVLSHNLNALKYAETISKQIEEICAPLFLNLGFTIFAYIKVMPDGRMLHLNSNSDWTKVFFEREFYNEDDCFHKLRSLVSKEGDKTFILSGTPQGKHPSTLYDFNIWNTYSIYKKREGFVEGWAFGTTRENKNILDIYLKNPFILNIFTLYFSEKAFDFTTNAHESNFIRTEKSFSETVEVTEDEINLFISTIIPNRFPIKFKGQKIVFSRREVECLTLLSSGYSVKETANLLKISSRTIESHIDKMKLKTNTCHKSELLRMYLDNFDIYEIKKLYKMLAK